MNFEERVYNEEFKLNDTDDSVISSIRLYRKNIKNISIHKIAEELHVSPNAVMRTAKKLGYSGFSELKFSIHKEDNIEDIRTVERSVLDKMPENITKSLDIIEDVDLHNIVTKMIKANKILFAGIGDSVYFCELFGRYLRCVDKRVEYYQQIHDIEYAARHCEKGDLLIIISASGEPKRLVDLAMKVKANNVETCCITHFGKNPLSLICDNQICFWGEKRVVNGYNVTDRSGLMLVIRLICEVYWKRLSE